jgi:hypothetical protein
MKANTLFIKLTYELTIFRSLSRNYQFGFTENKDILNGIAIWTLPTPVVFILNSTSYTYNLIHIVNEKNELIDFNVQTIMDNVTSGKLEVY